MPRPKRPRLRENRYNQTRNCFSTIEFVSAEGVAPIDPKLQPFLRIIRCDGYIVYPSWTKGRARIKLNGCRSHVRRKFSKPLSNRRVSSVDVR